MRNPIFIDLRYDVPFILPAFEQVFSDGLQVRSSKNTCLYRLTDLICQLRTAVTHYARLSGRTVIFRLCAAAHFFNPRGDNDPHRGTYVSAFQKGDVFVCFTALDKIQVSHFQTSL